MTHARAPSAVTEAQEPHMAAAADTKPADRSTVRQVPGARVYWLKPTRSRHCGTLTYVCRTRVTDHTDRKPALWDVGCVYVREADGLLRAEFRGTGSYFDDRDCATLDEAMALVEASLKPTPAPTRPCDPCTHPASCTAVGTCARDEREAVAADRIVVPQQAQQPQAQTRILARDPAADPIHAAIARHRAAYDAFQIAPDETADHGAALAASDDYDAANDALVETACATRFGALALLDHLRWWIEAEAEYAAAYQPAYHLAQARAADLSLFLGSRPSVAAIPLAAPCGRLAPERRAIDLRRVSRLPEIAAEALAAVAVIAGGMLLTGFATLL